MTEKNPTSVNKEDLLLKIKASYSRLYDFVEDLEEGAITKILEIDDWTIKDILAHIAAWEDVLGRFHIQAQPFDQIVGMESANYRDTEEDEVNERFYQRGTGQESRWFHLLEPHTNTLSRFSRHCRRERCPILPPIMAVRLLSRIL